MARASKFNVSKDINKRTFNNIVFDSVMEMKFYRDWVIPKMESGDIVSCDMQVKYELQEKFNHDGKTVLPINYIADFVIKYKNGHMSVIDTKGMPDSSAILKRKMFWYKYPTIDYQWLSYSKIDSDGIDGGWVPYEKVKKGRKERKKEKSNKKG